MSDKNTPSALEPVQNTAVLAHLNMVQAIITRLAGNSASCKTWCLTLVSALLSFAAAAHSPFMVRFALVPVVIFLFLDTMYLSQERAYRELFKRITALVRSGKYGLEHTFDLAADRKAADFFEAIGSWSIWPVYGSLIVAYAVAQYNDYFSILAVPAK